MIEEIVEALVFPIVFLLALMYYPVLGIPLSVILIWWMIEEAQWKAKQKK